ncbi:MAG: hypothetical protein FJ086_02270 [Deltaproteobacteria bacterium]|nr:hypothetical protein [Deltaproteobacteria bacterium]
MDHSRKAAARVYRDLYDAGARQPRRVISDYGLEREAIHHRMGLQPYRPARTALGGLSLFLVGSAAGAAIAWWLAPQQVKGRLQQSRARGLDFLDQARGVAEQAVERPLS